MPVKLISPETTAPLAGWSIFRFTVQSINGVGVGPSGVGGPAEALVASGVLPGWVAMPAGWLARVMVGTSTGVGSGGRISAVPSGVGDESGVAKMLGVGVGGFRSSAGRVGAMLALT